MSGTGNDFICTVYDRDLSDIEIISIVSDSLFPIDGVILVEGIDSSTVKMHYFNNDGTPACLLYTSPSPRDISGSRMPSSA